MDRGRLLTVNEAADEFWLEPDTIRKWLRPDQGRRRLTWAAPGLVWEHDVADAERATRRRPRTQRLQRLVKEEA